MVKRLLIGERRNGYSNDEQTTEFCKDKVTRGLRSLKRLPEGNVIQLKDIQNLMDAFKFLDSVINYLPSVECWCVVKKYADVSWADAVWMGCTKQEQAEAMCPAIQAHYQKGYDTPMRDRFVVEFRPCRLMSIVTADLTVEEYISFLS